MFLLTWRTIHVSADDFTSSTMKRCDGNKANLLQFKYDLSYLWLSHKWGKRWQRHIINLWIARIEGSLTGKCFTLCRLEFKDFKFWIMITSLRWTISHHDSGTFTMFIQFYVLRLVFKRSVPESSGIRLSHQVFAEGKLLEPQEHTVTDFISTTSISRPCFCCWQIKTLVSSQSWMIWAHEMKRNVYLRSCTG